MATSSTASNTAVWYSIGATFIFAAPVVFFSESSLWVTIAFMAVGAIVFAAGLVVFRREYLTRASAVASGGVTFSL